MDIVFGILGMIVGGVLLAGLIVLLAYLIALPLSKLILWLIDKF